MEKINLIKKKLLNGYLYVEFLKKDNTLRKMWCTRDNKIIQDCGHELIQFNHPSVQGRERKNPHLLFVYDIQENDTRILNVKTLDLESVKEFNILGEVEIPNIIKRFETKELTPKEKIKLKVSLDPESSLESDISIEDNGVGIDDLFK